MRMKFFFIICFLEDDFHGLAVMTPNEKIAYIGMFQFLGAHEVEYWQVKGKVWVVPFERIEKYQLN